jgi:hypothetical protein
LLSLKITLGEARLKHVVNTSSVSSTAALPPTV